VKSVSKVVQISVLAKVAGNVNADEVIGTRITLKKMYSSSGEVLPFVSARAIKFAIRQALKEKGFSVDPLIINEEAEEALRLSDSADPLRYVDNDLFGYMRTIGGKGLRGEGGALKRQAPIALSYFKALKDTPIKAEFGARFARAWSEKEEAPAPFEVEVAEFVGRVNCIMYDYIGDFSEDRKIAESMQKSKGREIKDVKEFLERIPEKLPSEERKKRIRAFAEVFLTPTYVLPKRTNSLNLPEYYAALLVFSEKGPLPIFQYLDWDFEKGNVNSEKLMQLIERKEIKENAKKILVIDYEGKVEKVPEGIEKTSVTNAIEEIANFL
jgi:CRISPR-associated protein Cst2